MVWLIVQPLGGAHHMTGLKKFQPLKALNYHANKGVNKERDKAGHFSTQFRRTARSLLSELFTWMETHRVLNSHGLLMNITLPREP